MRRPRSRSGRAGSSAPRTRRRARDASVERLAEHVVQHEREALGGAERLEQHEQRDAHLVAPGDEVGGIRLGGDGFVAPRFDLPRMLALAAGSAQLVEADA